MGTSDSLEYIEGNIATIELAKSYDLIFLSNMIHHFPSEQLQGIIQKLYFHLETGGTIAIWDLKHTEADKSIPSLAFSLFFYMTSGAQCYSANEINQFLSKAGFIDFDMIQPPSPSPHALYLARK